MSVIPPYKYQISTVFPSPMPYYYNVNANYVFYDGFEDGLLRWSQPDDHPEANGFTGISALATRGNGSTKALYLGGCITGSPTNQDANIDLGIAYPSAPTGSAYNPIIAMEFWFTSVDYLNALGISIERSDGIINKTEWKWTYNAQLNPRVWQQVTSNPSADTANSIFAQQIRPHSLPGISGWVPVKIFVDTGNTGSINSTAIISGNTMAYGPFVPNTFNSSLITTGMMKFEFSVTTNSANQIGDYLIDDVWISIEPRMP